MSDGDSETTRDWKVLTESLENVTVVCEYVHQGEEVDVVAVLAGDGVQVPVWVDHPVRNRSLLLQLPPPGTWGK